MPYLVKSVYNKNGRRRTNKHDDSAGQNAYVKKRRIRGLTAKGRLIGALCVLVSANDRESSQTSRY